MTHSARKGKEMDSAIYVGAKNREIIHLLDQIIRSNG